METSGESKTALTCPRCGARRILGPECPECGVIYAKARPREVARSQSSPAPLTQDEWGGAGAATPAENAEPWQPQAGLLSGAGTPALSMDTPGAQHGLWQPSARTPDFDPTAEAVRWERQLRRWAVPAAMLGTLLFTSTGMGRAVARLISGMWLHELGHAVAAWWCGYTAIPLPWFTSISANRSLFITLGLVGGLGYLAYRYGRAERWVSAVLFGVFAALAIVCRMLPGATTAQALITFAGDGGAMVFGALLVCSFYVPPGHALHRGALRWGFLVLGAIGFWDAFGTWWAARRDPGEIPFGHIERVGLSDSSRMVELYGWTERGLVNGYLVVGVLCLLTVAAMYLYGLRATPDAAHPAVALDAE